MLDLFYSIYTFIYTFIILCLFQEIIWRCVLKVSPAVLWRWRRNWVSRAAQTWKPRFISSAPTCKTPSPRDTVTLTVSTALAHVHACKSQCFACHLHQNVLRYCRLISCWSSHAALPYSVKVSLTDTPGCQTHSLYIHFSTCPSTSHSHMPHAHTLRLADGPHTHAEAWLPLCSACGSEYQAGRAGSGFSSAGQRGAWEHASTLLTHSGGENPTDAPPAITNTHTHTHTHTLAWFIMHVYVFASLHAIKSLSNEEKWDKLKAWSHASSSSSSRVHFKETSLWAARIKAGL